MGVVLVISAFRAEPASENQEISPEIRKSGNQEIRNLELLNSGYQDPDFLIPGGRQNLISRSPVFHHAFFDSLGMCHTNHFLCIIVVSISACHAEDLGSIPGRGASRTVCTARPQPQLV